MIITKSTPFTKEEIENKNKVALGALSMDLKRVALGLHRGSNLMAERFFKEALKRRDEVDLKTVKPYLVKLLKELENIKKETNARKAEDALLYSTIFQNASQNS
jgi:hypothetical protein